jgi:hypothetical protein
VVPGMMSGLAFVNSGYAYESLGAFCQLPIRPFWYRLALAWIPRYLIAFIILSLAGAIYAYVGCEFCSYTNLSQSSMTPVVSTLSMSTIDENPEPAVQRAQTEPCNSNVPEHIRRSSSIAHDVVSSRHRGLAVAFGPTTYVPAQLVPETAPVTQFLPESSTLLPFKRTAFVRPGLLVIPSGYTVNPALPALDLQGPLSPMTQPVEDPMAILVQPETATKEAIPRRDPSPPSPVQRHLARQRRRVYRQLRLLFIYPLVYILMWTIPFIGHVMNYDDHYANYPLWFTRIGMTICLTSMGFVDCLIFSLREKPWRSISTSDGTVWGSLAVWRRTSSVSASRGGRGGNAKSIRQRSRTESGVSTVAKVRNSVRTSASDDRSRMAAGQARKRLDMETDERLAAMTARLESGSEVYPGVLEKGKGKMVV